MKKKSIIILIALLLIAILIFSITKINKMKYNYEIESISQYNYYIYREDNQYGVINKEGKKIVSAKYTNVVIPNPQKDIFICYQNDDIEIKNSSDKQLYTEYETVEPIKLKNVASTLSYEKSVLKYKKDGLYGIMSLNGKIITKNLYSSIENLQPTEGKLLVSKDGKYGVIDIKGNKLVDIKFDQINSDLYYTEKDNYKKSGFIVANKQDDGYRYGYINYIGKTILDVKFNEIERISKEGNEIYLITAENGQYGLYKNSKNIIKNEYQAITTEDEEVVILKKNKKYGVATLAGKVIINVEKDSIEQRGIYLYANLGNDRVVYDKKGNVININYDKSIYETENENYRISTLVNNDITYYGITDKEGKQIVPENYRYIEFIFKNYFIATDENGNLGIIDSEGKEVLKMQYSTLQKIKGKNMIQAVSEDEDITEIYSAEIKKTETFTKPTINLQEDYVIVSSQDKNVYFNNNGEVIKDASTLKAIDYPEDIKEYKKQQTSIENVYYVKK